MEPRAGGNGRGTFRASLLQGDPPMNTSTLHKQGYIGNVSEKSKTELMELLERQEMILKNRKFIERLPDKGEKIRNFVKTLQELVSDKEGKENADARKDDTSVAMDQSEQISEQNSESVTEEQLKHEDELKIIERGFEQLSVHEGTFYQVIVKAGEREHGRSKFAANRPHGRETDRPDPDDEKHHKPSLRNVELTSASVHDPDHGAATVISVEECRSLYSAQQKKIQESRADQMADRMMRRMAGGGISEHPEGKYLPKDDQTMEEASLHPVPEYLDSVD